MIKSFLFIAILLCFATLSKSQSNSFANSATDNNKTWMVSKYVVSPSQEDLKGLFNNYTFQFGQNDTTAILITEISSSKAWKGFWNEQMAKVNIFLPFDPGNNSYSQVATLLNKAAFEKTSMTTSLLTFKMQDTMSQIEIEFSLK